MTSNKDSSYITESLQVGVSSFQGYIITFAGPRHFGLLILCKFAFSILEEKANYRTALSASKGSVGAVMHS